MVRRISWPLAGVVAAGLLLLTAGWFWWVGDVGTDPHPPAEMTHRVAYRVTGTGSAAEISWSADLDSGVEVASAPVALPWTRQATVARSAFTAHIEADADRTPVTCSITVDGTLVTTDTAPAGRTAACRYTFTAP